MNKHKVTVNMDAEIKQKIEAAASEKNISVSDYLLAAAQRQLVEDGEVATDPPLTKAESTQLVHDLREKRKKILAERHGELIDVDAIMDLILE
ncbi:MAG: hypothetical protein IT328_14270 [Caldilineaceae bacterium]|nr:hypothetical protein [Caldilineaceae bacterium]